MLVIQPQQRHDYTGKVPPLWAVVGNVEAETPSVGNGISHSARPWIDTIHRAFPPLRILVMGYTAKQTAPSVWHMGISTGSAPSHTPIQKLLNFAIGFGAWTWTSLRVTKEKSTGPACLAWDAYLSFSIPKMTCVQLQLSILMSPLVSGSLGAHFI